MLDKFFDAPKHKPKKVEEPKVEEVVKVEDSKEDNEEEEEVDDELARHDVDVEMKEDFSINKDEESPAP